MASHDDQILNLFATNQKCKYDFKKHSKRHNGPRLLSLKLDLSLKIKLIQCFIYIGKKIIPVIIYNINSTPWVRCASGNVLKDPSLSFTFFKKSLLNCGKLNFI